jgi:hypothetical protein
MPSSQGSQFPPLYVPDPAATIEDNKPLRDVIREFLRPTKGFYNEDCSIVKLTLVYAIGKLGLEQFDYQDFEAGTRILREGSIIKKHGLEEGMPKEVMDWLLGEPIAEEAEFPADVLEGEKDE